MKSVSKAAIFYSGNNYRNRPDQRPSHWQHGVYLPRVERYRRATNHPSHLGMNVSIGNMCTALKLQGVMSISYNNILICVTTFTIIKI